MNPDEFLPDAQTVAAIEKDIALYNQRREEASADLAKRKPLFRTAFVLALAFLAFLSLWLYVEKSRFFLLPLMAAGGFGMGAWKWTNTLAGQDAGWTQQAFRDHILPVMFGFVKDLRYEHGTTPRSFDRLPREVVSRNRQTFDDVIRGSLDGRRFELFEVTMGETHKGGQAVTFKGLVLYCRLRNPFAGTLIFYRKVGSLMRFLRSTPFGRSLSLFESGQQNIDSLFDCISDNRRAARALIASDLGDMLSWIERKWHGDTVRLAIEGDHLFLMLPSERDFFELPPIDQQLEYRFHVEPMARQFASLLAIVERAQQIDGKPADAAT